MLDFLKDIFGGDDDSSQPAGISRTVLPDFWEDPFVGKTQDELYNFGSNLLSGNPNDYYKPIGEIGGSMFEDVLARVVRDTTKSTEEDAIRRGVGRGGPVSTAISKSVADVSSSMRWSDVLRALEGRKYLLNKGDSMLSGVRSAAFTNQAQKNSYELDKAKTQGYLDEQTFNQNASLGQEQGGGIAGIFDQIENLIPYFTPGKKDSFSPMDIEGIVSGQKRGSAEGNKKTEFYKDPNFYMDAAKLAMMFA